MDSTVLVRAQFDPSTDRSVSLLVVETLALVVDDELALRPLAFSIDTDSLDGLFSPQFGQSPPRDLHVSFSHEGWEIGVSSVGEITISTRQDCETEHS